MQAVFHGGGDVQRQVLHLHVFLRTNGMLYIALHRKRPTLAHFQMTFAEKGRLAC